MSALIEVFDKYPLDGSLIEAEAEATYEAMIAASFARLDALQIESDILLAGKELGVMVVEDVEITTIKNGPKTQKNLRGVFAHISDFLGKIIKFLKDAISNFFQGISNSMATAEEWYASNKKYLDQLNNMPDAVKNMKLTVIPYWDVTVEYNNLKRPNFPIYKNSLDAVFREMEKNPQSIPSKDEVFSKYFPDLAKLNKDDPRKATLDFYQGAAANDSSQTPAERAYNGEEGMTAIHKMEAFMDLYKDFVNKTKTMAENNEKEMERIKAELDKEGVSTEGVDYVFGYDLYSPVGECYLTDFIDVVDKYGNPARESILKVPEFTMEDNSANVMQGTNPPPQKTEGKDQKTDTQTQTKADPNKNTNADKPNQPNTNTGNNENAGADATAKQQALNKIFQICATVSTARMTALKNIADHYVNTLQDLVKKIKEYQGIQDEDEENRNYNEKQKAQDKMKNEDEINQIVQNRKKANAAIHGRFRRIIDRNFGK